MMMSMTKFTRLNRRAARAERGFTLIEVMVWW